MLDKILWPIIIMMLASGGVIYSWMSATINQKEAELNTLKSYKAALEVDIQTEKSNNEVLNNTIDALTQEIKKMELRNQNTIREYNNFVKKSKEEKYNRKVLNIMNATQWSNATCQEAMELNKMISELNYEDL